MRYVHRNREGRPATHIEVHQPRLEALIQQRMASGRFESIEDALVQALESAPLPPEQVQAKPRRTGAELVDACAKISGSLTDEEIDTMFRRNPATARPVDFANEHRIATDRSRVARREHFPSNRHREE